MNRATTPICARFDRQAAHYERLADVQQAIAWRLAHCISHLPLPQGLCADLGAGSGLVGQALQRQAPAMTLWQIDGSPALLARNPLAERSVLWDLEQGLPADLQQCALLTSSFTLQWLSQPAARLRQWAAALAPGGWLVLAVPVAGCFPQWHEAATRAQVPCTAQPLPSADDLIAAAGELLCIGRAQQLWFSRRFGDGRTSAAHAFLRHVRELGAGSSSQQPLSTPQWRRLLAHWPNSPLVSWRVLMLVGQRRAGVEA